MRHVDQWLAAEGCADVARSARLRLVRSDEARLWHLRRLVVLRHRLGKIIGESRPRLDYLARSAVAYEVCVRDISLDLGTATAILERLSWMPERRIAPGIFLSVLQGLPLGTRVVGRYAPLDLSTQQYDKGYAIGREGSRSLNRVVLRWLQYALVGPLALAM